MTTNAVKTHVVNRQLLADLPDRLVELVHRDEAAPARKTREDAIAATASCAEHRGPNGPKIQKETTHDLLSRRRRV